MLYADSGYTSLNKMREELCGDRVEFKTSPEGARTLVLCDGLGSGVKANILATLSSKILCTMINSGAPIYDCVETLIGSLPVCKVRKVAYSTFTVLTVAPDGESGTLVEFDNPPAIFMRDGKCIECDREALNILGKTVYTTNFKFQDGDALVMTSDGVVLAGVGKLMNFGWQRNEIKEYLERAVTSDMTGAAIACSLCDACNSLYMQEPGDDTTVLGVRFKKPLRVSVMVGPPVDKANDDFYVERFLSGGGKKVVCGGTSSLIVARHLKTEVKTSMDFPDREIPPIGFIKGVDLTTEGVITLRRLNELAQKYVSPSDLTPKIYPKRDGASLLADMLFVKATEVVFYVGQSVNKAHQGLPIDNTMKMLLIDKLSDALKKMGKKVTVNYD